MTRSEMAQGLALLATAFGRELTDELVGVFHGVLGPKLDGAAWGRAVTRALERESFFPPPAVLLRYGRDPEAPEARAVEVYERVLLHYESGQAIGPREVRELYGTAAMEAFVAAGGSRAFAWCEPAGEPFRRKAFVEAWVSLTDLEPTLSLPRGVAGELEEGADV